MFREKKEVIKFNDFVSGAYKQKPVKAEKEKSHIPFIPAILTTPVIFNHVSKVFAATGTTVIQQPVLEVGASAGEITKMLEGAFSPLFDMLQGFGYPVATAVIIGGAIKIMLGNKEKGFEMMQNAALGYSLLWIGPKIFYIISSSLKVLGVAMCL